MSDLTDWDGRPADTTPEAWERFLELQRRMTLSQKLELTLQLSADLFSRIRAGVKLQYPNASEREVFLRTAARHLDRETMINAYGWDPECDAPPSERP